MSLSLTRISSSLAVMLTAGMVFAACAAQTPEESPAPAADTDTMETMEETGTSESMDDMGDDNMETADATEMTVDMFNFGYSEETIEATPGETLNIELTNSDGYHDFMIDELDVDSGRTNAGEVTSVTFTVPEDAAPGTTYEYYCSVGSHRAQGMVGTLEVVAE